MRNTVTFTLRDREGRVHSYETVLYPGGEGTDMLPEMAEVFAEALDGYGGMAGRLRRLAQLMVTKGRRELLLRLLRYTTRDGESLADTGVWNTAFQGNQLELMLAATKAAEANFGDFFSEAGLVQLKELGFIDEIPTRGVVSPSSTAGTATSTGGSGVSGGLDAPA